MNSLTDVIGWSTPQNMWSLYIPWNDARLVIRALTAETGRNASIPYLTSNQLFCRQTRRRRLGRPILISQSSSSTVLRVWVLASWIIYVYIIHSTVPPFLICHLTFYPVLISRLDFEWNVSTIVYRNVSPWRCSLVPRQWLKCGLGPVISICMSLSQSKFHGCISDNISGDKVPWL